MFSSNEKFYEYIDGIILRLADAGEAEWASALREAKLRGSTGGEVLGDIYLVLKKLQSSKAAAKLGMQGEIRKVTWDVWKALRR